MTLLSRVFSAHSTISEQGQTKKIGIRNLRMPSEQEEAASSNLSLDQVILERDRMMKQASIEIELEKANLEKLRQNTVDDIEVMRSGWDEEKQMLQQQAYDEGFQIGYEEGRKKAIAEMEQSIQLANATTAQSKVSADKYVESQERVILDLAMTAASRIIGQAIEDHEETFLSIVRRGLKEAREMKEIKLYVSLEHFDFISKNQAELAEIFPPDVPFLIFVNEDFQTTDCYIETNHGRIVVSVDEQLNELKERLVEILESGA